MAFITATKNYIYDKSGKKIEATKGTQYNANLYSTELPKEDTGMIKTSATSAVNPKYISEEGLRRAKNYGSLPSTISSDILSGTTLITLPEVTQNTAMDAGASVSGITEGLSSSLKGLIDNENKKVQSAQSKVQTETSTFQSLLNKLGLKGQTQTALETEAGIPELTKEYTNIQNEYDTKALEYRRMEEAVMKVGTLTDAQKQARLSQISREKNTELADIGIKMAVAQNNLTATQNLVDRKIDLEFGDIKDLITYQQNFLEYARDDLNKAEETQLNLLITDNTRKYEEGKSIGEFAKTVASNGAPANVISAVSSAKTMNDALQAAGQWINKPKETTIPTIKSINGVDMQWNPTTNQWEKPSITGISGVDGELQLSQAETNINSISNLMTSSGLKSAVGPNTSARVSVFEPFTSKRANFIASIEQLTSQLSLDSLIQAKAQGATFGALSDREMQILSQSATKIASWAVTEKQKDGTIKVIGYQTTEEEFKKELEKINDYAKLDYLYRGGDPANVGAAKMPNGKFVIIQPDGNYKELN